MNARTTSSVGHGAAAVLTAQLAVYLAGFVTSVLISRAVGPQGRGEYYIPVLAATMTMTIFSFGIESSSSVHFSQGASLAALTRLTAALAIVLGPIATSLMIAAFFAFRGSAFDGISVVSVLIVAPTVGVALHQLWLTNMFLLAKRIGYAERMMATGALLQLVSSAVLYALSDLRITEVLVLYDVSVVLPWALMVREARTFADLRPGIDTALLRKVLGFGLRMHGGLLFAYLVLRADVILVNILRGTTAVGVYSVAVLYAELAWLVTNPLAQAAVPFQADLPPREGARLAFKAARFNLVLACLVGAGFAATLWFVIPRLYGPGFQGSYHALLLLLPGVIAMAASRPLALVIGRENRALGYTVMGAACFVVNAGITLALVPPLGIEGAAVASTAAYLLTSVVFVWWAATVADESPLSLLVPCADDMATARRAQTALVARLRRLLTSPS